MNARFLDVLHDTSDVDVFAVTDGVHVDLDGVAQVAVDQDRVVAGDLHGLADVLPQTRRVVDDLHATTAQHVGRAEQNRVADGLSHGFHFFRRPAQAVGRLAQVDVVEQLLEALAVFGQVDGVRRGAEDRHTSLFERRSNLERRLTPELNDHTLERAVLLLLAGDGKHVLFGQRLEVEAVGRVVVGRNGLWVTVDHDGLVACFLECVTSVDTAIVELDALTDPVWTTAKDHDLLAIRRLSLTDRRVVAVVDDG